MEPSVLIQTAVALIGLAAGGGLVLGFMCLVGFRRTPYWLTMGHGMTAVLGLALLTYAAAIDGIPPMAKLALGLFAVSAAGGAAITLLIHRKRDVKLSAPLVLGDAFLGAVGFVLLLLSIYGQRYVDTLSPIVLNNS